MDLQKAVGKIYAFIGMPYEEMVPWKRRLIIQIFALVDGMLDTLVYLPFVLLPYLALCNEWNFQRSVVAMWCACEVAFYICCCMRLNTLNKLKKEVAPMDSRTRLELASTICEHMIDAEEDLGGWLIRRQPGKLNIGEVSTWLIWAFFGKEPDELTTTEWDEAAVILKMYKEKLGSDKRWGMKGKDESKCMRPTLDEFKPGFRPLIFVALFGIYKMVLNAVWYLDGYRWRWLSPGVSYLIREPTEKEDGMPILFLHGGSLGIYLYTVHFSLLARQYPSRRILVLYIPSFSNTPLAYIPSLDEITHSIDKMLNDTKTSKVSILAHSYGSFVAGWLAKHSPSCIGKVTLVDPVAFEVWNSTSVLTTLYCKPVNIVNQLLWLITKDPTSQACLQSLWLPRYVVFPESFTFPTQVYIAERDWIVNGPKNYKYLMDRKAKSNLDNFNVHLIDMTHGEYLLSQEHFNSFHANL